MKKLAMLFLILSTAIFATACSNASKADTFNQEKFLDDIKPNIVCYDSCLQEVFGAEVDFNEESYSAAYTSESAYANGSGEVAILFKASEEANYADYFKDPVASSYYQVKNFNSNNDVRENLKKYLSDSVIDEVFKNDFFEYDGKLFMVRGAKGYGAISVDSESAKYLEEKDGKQYVSIGINFFNEFDHTEKLEFSQIDGAWIITAVTKEQ